VRPAKTAEPIEMPFVADSIGRRNHVLDGALIPIFGVVRFTEKHWEPLQRSRTQPNAFSQLFHSATCDKRDGYWDLCLEVADKIVIFAVLEQRLLRRRETEAIFIYIFLQFY